MLQVRRYARCLLYGIDDIDHIIEAQKFGTLKHVGVRAPRLRNKMANSFVVCHCGERVSQSWNGTRRWLPDCAPVVQVTGIVHRSMKVPFVQPYNIVTRRQLE